MGDSRERSAEEPAEEKEPGKSQWSGTMSGGTDVRNPQLQFVMPLLAAKVGRKSCTQQNGCLGCEEKPRQGWPTDCTGVQSCGSLSADRVGCLDEEEEARNLPLSSAPFPKFRGS
jgi:hypothetical protein